jgi:hypothetical protein
MPHKKTQHASRYETQKSRTAKNKANAAQRHLALIEKFTARTDSLVGSHVKVRTKESVKATVGTVLAVIRKGDESYPTDAKRSSGAYLKVRTTHGEKIVSRHRVKPVREVI